MPTRAKSLESSRIFAEIEAQPPLMRPQAAKAYLGKLVDWLVIFANASEHSGQAHLILRSDPHGVRMITGKVLLVEHPELRSLHSGEQIRVRGRIRKIDNLSIELEINQLVFAPATRAPALSG